MNHYQNASWRPQTILNLVGLPFDAGGLCTHENYRLLLRLRDRHLLNHRPLKILPKFCQNVGNILVYLCVFRLILDVFGRRDPQNRIGLEKLVPGHHFTPPKVLETRELCAFCFSDFRTIWAHFLHVLFLCDIFLDRALKRKRGSQKGHMQNML